ncbi:33443_t:CDS:2, partial [Gigaspora margarita]
LAHTCEWVGQGIGTSLLRYWVKVHILLSIAPTASSSPVDVYWKRDFV